MQAAFVPLCGLHRHVRDQEEAGRYSGILEGEELALLLECC